MTAPAFAYMRSTCAHGGVVLDAPSLAELGCLT